MVNKRKKSKQSLSNLIKTKNLEFIEQDDGDYFKDLKIEATVHPKKINLLPSKPYHYYLSPKLQIYSQKTTHLENLLKLIKNSRAKAETIYTIVNVGILDPPDCNFFYNPALTLEKNCDLLEKNMFKNSYLEMTQGLDAYERYCIRLHSAWRETKVVKEKVVEDFVKDQGKIFGFGYLGNLNDKRLLKSHAKHEEIAVGFDDDQYALYNLKFWDSEHVDADDEVIDVDHTKFEVGFLSFLDDDLRLRRYDVNLRTYCDSNMSTNPEVIKLTKLSQKLYFEKIPKLINYVEQNSIFPSNSLQVKDLFAKFGVNLAHMGIVAFNTEFPALRAILIEEMIARSLKKIFYYSFSKKFYQVKNC
jgi:hypothetical protein